jgi:hypothetical protein
MFSTKDVNYTTPLLCKEGWLRLCEAGVVLMWPIARLGTKYHLDLCLQSWIGSRKNHPASQSLGTPPL